MGRTEQLDDLLLDPRLERRLHNSSLHTHTHTQTDTHKTTEGVNGHIINQRLTCSMTGHSMG